MERFIQVTHWPRKMAAGALGALALFLLVATLGQIQSLRYIGSGVAATDTISVSGEGEVFAIPDTATFSVTVEETAKQVTDAQAAAAKKSNDIVAYLKKQGIDDKDVQTADYSVNPQYDYSGTVCPQYGYCPPGKQVLTGYQVSQTLTVKVRDAKKAGDILSGVGSRGASNVSSLSFDVDDRKALEAEARGKAITDARTQAEALAKQLGVKIVRIVNFNENNGGPVYYEIGRAHV